MVPHALYRMLKALVKFLGATFSDQLGSAQEKRCRQAIRKIATFQVRDIKLTLHLPVTSKGAAKLNISIRRN